MLDARVAEHEAAHVVVGLALGLKLGRASTTPSVEPNVGLVHGSVWFREGRGRMAMGIMFAAGRAWEQRAGGTLWWAWRDTELARRYLIGPANLKTAVKVAREILDGRRRVHAKIASELCDRDLTSADIEALILGL